MSSTKRITVILPVHNAMPYLPAAVDSLLNQRAVDLHIRIINDGSTDGSTDYLNNVRHPSVEVIHRDRSGLGAVLNYGLETCRTEYTGRMDADDISMPDRFGRQLAFLDAHPDVVMVGTQIEFLIGSKTQRGLRCRTSHEDIDEMLMAGKSGISHPTLLMRTEVARRIGGYRIPGNGEEVDFCLRMCEQGQVTNIPRTLYQYRLHGGSVSVTKQRDVQLGYAYAAYTARQRRTGCSEMSMADFTALWANRGHTERFFHALDRIANVMYRNGRIDFANDRWVRGALRMIVTASVQPAITMKHVGSLFWGAETQ